MFPAIRGYYYDTESELYYLQSRYYDPVTCRFINADSYASTGQGMLGFNMFIYCLNNPTSYVDSFGKWPMGHNTVLFNDGGSKPKDKINNLPIRDVTNEVNTALHIARKAAEKEVFCSIPSGVAGQMHLYSSFYKLVNHSAPWNIKREPIWENTIGTEYPGFNTPIIYDGYVMTVESMGNYTYGYLGAAYGFPCAILIAGSYYAADFPTSGSNLSNELKDWMYVSIGYRDYFANKCHNR